MILDRINRKLPARLAELDESLGNPYDILKWTLVSTIPCAISSGS
jgi:hypothetical protein